MTTSAASSGESGGSSATSPIETPAKRIKFDACCSSIKGGASAAPSVTPASSDVSNDSPAPLSDEEIRLLLKQEAEYDCKTDELTPKRTGYLSWDDYFIGLTLLSAQRSKDPKTPTGACIVDDENRVVGIGYNGFPRGCSDDVLPWVPAAVPSADGNETSWLHTPSPYECHAEVNAIVNSIANVAGARLYVAQFPCNECAKVIIQSSIRQVIYLRDDKPDKDTYRASRIMFSMAGVTMRQYSPFNSSIAINLTAEMDSPGALGVADKSDYDPSQFRELLLKEANLDPTTTPSTKRKDYLTWDDYFMAVAFLTAQRSKDPNTQVGACIVDKNKCIIGLGYNGFPSGCSDDHLPWSRTTKDGTPAKHTFLHRKYAYVCHAEVNAILNKRSADVKGATLYVALFPCNECAKTIIQSGIREVVYLSDRYHDDDAFRASRILFTMAGVKLRQHIPCVETVKIVLKETGDEKMTSSKAKNEDDSST